MTFNEFIERAREFTDIYNPSNTYILSKENLLIKYPQKGEVIYKEILNIIFDGDVGDKDPIVYFRPSNGRYLHVEINELVLSQACRIRVKTQNVSILIRNLDLSADVVFEMPEMPFTGVDDKRRYTPLTIKSLRIDIGGLVFINDLPAVVESLDVVHTFRPIDPDGELPALRLVNIRVVASLNAHFTTTSTITGKIDNTRVVFDNCEITPERPSNVIVAERVVVTQHLVNKFELTFIDCEIKPPSGYKIVGNLFVRCRFRLLNLTIWRREYTECHFLLYGELAEIEFVPMGSVVRFRHAVLTNRLHSFEGVKFIGERLSLKGMGVTVNKRSQYTVFSASITHGLRNCVFDVDKLDCGRDLIAGETITLYMKSPCRFLNNCGEAVSCVYFCKDVGDTVLAHKRYVEGDINEFIDNSFSILSKIDKPLGIVRFLHADIDNTVLNEFVESAYEKYR